VFENVTLWDAGSCLSPILERDCFEAINPAARLWLDTIAHQREHGSAHKKPIELFAKERPKLVPLRSCN